MWTGKIIPLNGFVARMYVYKSATPSHLELIEQRLNLRRADEEWLYSHPSLGGNSTPIPVLIQQDFNLLTKIRMLI
jgi:hypothetical protein